MTDQELRDELMLLTLAGYETTATTMAWALYWIHYLPEVHNKLLQELDSFSDYHDKIKLSQLPYLSAVCNETLRISPTVMTTFSRVVQEPFELMGYSLEPGTLVQGCIYLVHHREDLYPEAKQFKPERFLERKFSPYEFLPFGGGTRRCIGEALAVFQMKLVLATILSNYQLALVDNEPQRPQRQGFTLGPVNGVKMLLKGHRTHRESLADATTASAY